MIQLRPMSEAPRDGTLFDVFRRGIRWIDCHFDERGRLVREHGFPSVTQWFYKPDEFDGWLPRPDGLVPPYMMNDAGERYIPL